MTTPRERNRSAPGMVTEVTDRPPSGVIGDHTPPTPDTTVPPGEFFFPAPQARTVPLIGPPPATVIEPLPAEPAADLAEQTPVPDEAATPADLDVEPEPDGEAEADAEPRASEPIALGPPAPPEPAPDPVDTDPAGVDAPAPSEHHVPSWAFLAMTVGAPSGERPTTVTPELDPDEIAERAEVLRTYLHFDGELDFGDDHDDTPPPVDLCPEPEPGARLRRVLGKTGLFVVPLVATAGTVTLAL